MKIFLNKTVLEASKERIKYLFSEFENIVVGISGGKDSTVVFNLCYDIAKELGRLPLNVMWIDQEAEWTSTVEEVKYIMNLTDVKPYWFQIPMKLTNSTSTETNYLECWEKGAEWLRDKDPISIKENKYGTDRFGKLFEAICKVEFKGLKTAMVAGVRAEESPVRHLGVTAYLTYKDITWGKKFQTKDLYTFYPIYDWSYTDVWKAINENGWKYNKVYDYQYKYGIPVKDMRVSNLHHETAVKNLFYLQEVDSKLYNKLVKRLPGIATASQMQKDFFVSKLPFMFKGWKEYRDFLLEKLIKPENHALFRKGFRSHDMEFEHLDDYNKILKGHVQILMVNDIDGTKLKNLGQRYSYPETRAIRKQKEKLYEKSKS